MERRGTYLRVAGLVVIACMLVMLSAAALWQGAAGVAQVQSSHSVVGATPWNNALPVPGYDIWQYGTWFPVITGPGLDPNAGGIQIDGSSPTSTTLIVVGTAPQTATVTSARIMIDRDSSSDASGYVELAICEGKDVKRKVSAAPLAVDTDSEFVWIDIALVQSAAASTVAPSEYLCIAAVKTSAGTLYLDSVLQVTVRYWAAPTDYMYLPDIKQ